MKTGEIPLNVLIIFALLISGLGLGAMSPIVANSDITANIMYVKVGGTGNCGTWETACELQTALDIATSGDQVWVAAGTYKPSAPAGRGAVFILESGVAIYGGFPTGGGDWVSRNWTDHTTTLSGDIGTTGVNTDNSFHVVVASGVDNTAILDGFTISGGYADDVYPDNNGGGILNLGGSPTLNNLNIRDNLVFDCGGGVYSEGGDANLVNVTFTNNYGHSSGGGMCNSDSSSSFLANVSFSGNSAQFYGGGLYNYGNSNPTLTDVTFFNNFVNSSEEGYGGGMYNYSNCSPLLVRVTFTNNSSAYIGGGMYNDFSSPNLKDVSFSDNSAGYAGGGMVNYQSNSTLTNVTFSANSANDYGGGLDNYTSSPTLTNVTFSGNSSSIGGGLFNTQDSNPLLTNITFYDNSATNGGGLYNYLSDPILTNSILWGNTPNQIYNDNSTTSLTYSDIQGGHAGIGNIDLSPLLGNLADNGGYTMTHTLGEGSPAIDAGNLDNCPSTDQRGFLRPIDGNSDGLAICDMGAYESDSYLPFYVHLPVIVR